ncbi:universal stress protein [Lentilactobacillus buchneri]|uniref:Universal stress protein n=2 Tax=Lentilactobacillus buchneri TaxID=1581 RepID=J9W1L9_LENBU|nr:universal stress protein [Lentilactobacillus buchneri]MCC6100134.1 universal stress protein [Lactobacillus sp.]WCJ51900.1 universal stress protein [Lentilactobacillus sp. Egmn17]AEB73498.1 UspA domain-containing protein [Lentilactobacillus buchneri NRRL B-30929]AFS00403.1 putative universal stress protein [Lentilactobacillus buchneri subsp. silagei CD034]KRK69027.1 UspA domain-containing protein [Lentilactobacillus buchneri DSM 20057]
MYDNILVPLDGSKNSQQALEEACKLAKQFDSKLQLVTVINNTNFYYGAGAAGMPPSMYDDQHKIAENIIDEAKKYADSQGVKYETAIDIGNPKNIIAHVYPDEHDVDLIVIGKSGVDAINRLLIGSTTAFVVRNATTKVLVVNTKG